MHVTELPINKAIGVQLAPSDSTHLLELLETPLLLNHLGTIHASVQYALAEACSGEFLLRELGSIERDAFAVLRTSAVKFRKPARGRLRAAARVTDGAAETLVNDLNARSRGVISVLVEIADGEGVVTMTGQYDWFVQRQTNTVA
jgi:acyl-coenzyme A thioesterase PaaI-like protein